MDNQLLMDVMEKGGASLKNNEIFECFYLPFSITKNSFPVDIPNFAGNKAIYYQPDDLLAHFELIIQLTQKHKNYHVAVLPKPEFTDFKVLKSGSGNIFAISFTPPVLMINYTNEIVNQEIRNYINETMYKYLKKTKELEEIYDRLVESLLNK